MLKSYDVTNALVRTQSGLANQHVFLGVDFVVYVEGGGSFGHGIEAAASGAEDTHDAEFWRAIFNVTSPEKTFHVKSVGCKSVAEQIALTIARTGAPGTFVCTDSDISSLLFEAGPLVPTFRTWGYSWENDAACWEVAAKVFTDLHGGSTRARSALEQFQAWYDQHLEEYRPYIADDVKQIKLGLTAVFDRDAPVRPLGPLSATSPKLDTIHLNSRILDDERLNLISIDENHISPIRHGVGKTLFKAVYHAILFFGQVVRRVRMDFKLYVSLCISAMRSTLQMRSDAFSYYTEGVRCITAR